MKTSPCPHSLISPTPIRAFPMTVNPDYTCLIFDLGDVLFSWSSETKTSISPKVLRKILSSTAWYDYERGRINEDACYALVGEEFSLDPAEISNAFNEARKTLTSNTQMISFIRELKDQSQGLLRVFAMSNVSQPDWDVLRAMPVDWSIFDDVFPSFAAGERKPHLGFYRHVLERTQVEPSRTIFVDDKLENVLSARSVGMQGIVFDDYKNVSRTLRNLIGNPIKRGYEYLKRNARQMDSVTDTGVSMKENFTQLLILEATKDESLVHIESHPHAWNFFVGKPVLTSEDYPCDFDTTSLALTILKMNPETICSVMDDMLKYLDADGIIPVYFDHRRPRFDPVVCVNTIALFYANGRASQVEQTLQWVHDVLFNRAYLDGTRYYDSPECFLYFLSRLLTHNDDQALYDLLMPLLKERVKERIGAEADALALSMRILTCASLGIRDDADLRKLLPLQCEDGGWEIGWAYRYGKSGVKIGSRGLTTALAVKAIASMEPVTSPSRSSMSTVVNPTTESKVMGSEEFVPPRRSIFARLRSLFRCLKINRK